MSFQSSINTELLPHIHELAIHPHANKVLQTVVARGSRPQRLAMVWPLRDQLADLLIHDRGHYYVLAALRNLDSHDASVLLTFLANKVDEMIDIDAGYGIKSLLLIIEYFPITHLGFVLDTVVHNALAYACKKRGFQMIEKLLMKGEEVYEHTWFLLNELILHHDRIVTLCCDPLGCRTLTAFLSLGSHSQRFYMVDRLMSYVAPFSCSPHGSYVAEGIVRATLPERQFDLTFAIVRARPEFGYRHPLVMMADIPCANFVIERMLECYEGDALYHLRVVLNSIRHLILASNVGSVLWQRLVDRFTMPETNEVPYVPPPPVPADMGVNVLPFVPPNIYPIRARGDSAPIEIAPDFPSVAEQDVQVLMRDNLAYVEDPLVQWFNIMTIRADSSDYRLSAFKGHFLALALDRSGGQFMQGRLNPEVEGNPNLGLPTYEEISDVINEILPYFYLCCKNLYATHVVQQLFRCGPEGLRMAMFENLLPIMRHFIRAENACHVVAAALASCSDDCAWHIVDHLVSNVRSGLKNKYNVVVLRAAVELYGIGELAFIRDTIMEDVAGFVCHKNSGPFMQFLIEYPTADPESLAAKQEIMSAIAFNAAGLVPTIRDRSGNYTIQKILANGNAEMRTQIFQAVRDDGSFAELSDLQTSRVVMEKLFEIITEEQQLALVQDLANAPVLEEPFMLGDVPLANCPFVRMASGVFSRRVVATMCEHSIGAAREALGALIGQHIDDLQHTLSAEVVAGFLANLN